MIAQDTELPEPSEPTISYEFEISWGSKTTLAWTPITPVSIEMLDGVAITTHAYSGRIGINTFESVAWNTTTEKPMKVIVKFDIKSLPEGKWWDIFRIHSCLVIKYPPPAPLQGGLEDRIEKSGWSPPSYWVMVVDLSKVGTEPKIRITFDGG